MFEQYNSDYLTDLLKKIEVDFLEENEDFRIEDLIETQYEFENVGIKVLGYRVAEDSLESDEEKLVVVEYKGRYYSMIVSKK